MKYNFWRLSRNSLQSISPQGSQVKSWNKNQKLNHSHQFIHITIQLFRYPSCHHDSLKIIIFTIFNCFNSLMNLISSHYSEVCLSLKLTTIEDNLALNLSHNWYFFSKKYSKIISFHSLIKFFKKVSGIDNWSSVDGFDKFF